MTWPVPSTVTRNQNLEYSLAFLSFFCYFVSMMDHIHQSLQHFLSFSCFNIYKYFFHFLWKRWFYLQLAELHYVLSSDSFNSILLIFCLIDYLILGALLDKLTKEITIASFREICCWLFAEFGVQISCS